MGACRTGRKQTGSKTQANEKQSVSKKKNKNKIKNKNKKENKIKTKKKKKSFFSIHPRPFPPKGPKCGKLCGKAVESRKMKNEK